MASVIRSSLASLARRWNSFVEAREQTALIEARPFTGRTHQIRVHLRESGLPIIGDDMYGTRDRRGMALRAVKLVYHDPFTRKRVEIRARTENFCHEYGYDGKY